MNEAEAWTLREESEALRETITDQSRQLERLAVQVEHAAKLESELRKTLGEMREALWYVSLKSRIRGVVARSVPAGSVVAVVSRGDDDLLDLGGRTALHFPRTVDGEYAGHYPADSVEAIGQVEAVRRAGADFLLFPQPALWWLKEYEELGKHLATRYPVTVRQDDSCVIYDLRAQPRAEVKVPRIARPELAPSRFGAGLAEMKKLLEDDVPGVIEEISPDDIQFRACDNRPYYFSAGRSALRAIRLAMLAAGKDTLTSILDLPCGHGRVLRTLKAAFPQARLHACDLDHDAVDFCAATFGAIPHYSRESPSDIRIEGEFDLIWVGSLLTHLDRARWTEFLSLFSSRLAPGGLLVFTTHGRYVAERLRSRSYTYALPEPTIRTIVDEFDRDGFAYGDYPAGEGYGISLSLPSRVCGILGGLPQLQLLNVTERGWNHHQDVFACARLSPGEPA